MSGTATRKVYVVFAVVLGSVVAIGACKDPVSPRTAIPQVCTQNEFCQFRLAAGSQADTSKLPLWQPLGCGPMYWFQTGKVFGTGSLCVDSPENRKQLHDAGKRGLVPGECGMPPAPAPSRCLSLPQGMIFVEWSIGTPPPFCPSTCQDTPGPTDF
jgi:hypothetical protein